MFENTIDMLEMAYIIGKGGMDNKLTDYIINYNLDGKRVFATFISYLYGKYEESSTYKYVEDFLNDNIDMLQDEFIKELGE